MASLALVTVVGGLAVPAAVAAPAYLANQWGLGAINVGPAWGYTHGSGAKIGIVDTGIDFNQPDLAGKIAASQSFVSSPSSGCGAETTAQDDNGHGTHVAGIAAADGAVGVMGVAPSASIYMAKVLDCTGSGQINDVIAGINWLVSEHVDVINLSLGNSTILGINFGGNPLAGPLTNAWNAGVIPVVAGGNNGNGNGTLGLGRENFSNVPAVIVVATGKQDEVASYSNTIANDAMWAVAAPGGDDPNAPTPQCGSQFWDPAEILSSYLPPQGSGEPCYATDEGTSMATPFVTGSLALLRARGLSPSAAVDALLHTANAGVNCGSPCSGLVDVGAAMASTGPPPSAPAHGVAPTTTHPAPVAHSTPASSTTSSSSSTSSSAPTTSTVAPRVRAAGASRASGSGPSGHSSILWLVLPIVLGAALLGGLAWYATRDGSRELAMVQLPTEDGAAVTVPPADPPPHTGGGI